TQDPQTKHHSSSLSADREASLGDTGADAEIGGTKRYNDELRDAASWRSGFKKLVTRRANGGGG
ncbi:hypothetical protein KUCAC02_008999, partial [Chaenocephalus aceratus]